MSKLSLTPIIGMIIGVLASFVLFFPIAFYIDVRLTDSYLEEERTEVLQEAAQLRRDIESDLNLALSLTKGMEAPYAIKGNLSLSEFNLLAKELTSQLTFVRNIAVTEGTVFKYVFPEKGNESVLGLDYKNIKTQWPAIEKAIQTQSTIIAGPLELIQGGIGLIQRTPVYEKSGGIKGAFLGLVSVVINVDNLLASAKNTNLTVAFRKLDLDGTPHAVFFGDATLFEQEHQAIQSDIFHRGGAWQMAVAPKNKWGSTVQDEISKLHFVLYGFLSCILLVSAYAGYYEVNRRQLSNAFKNGRARYLSLLENAPDAMLFLDQDGKIDEGNRKAVKLLAFDNGGMRGRSIETLLPAIKNTDIFSSWDVLLENLRQSNSLEGLEAKVQNGKGITFDAEISVGFAGDTKSQQVILTLRDVTEKRQLQFERNLAEETLREAINTIPDGFAIYDAQDRLYLFNDAYAEIYSASAAALQIGTNFKEIIKFGLDNGQYPQAGKTLEDQQKWMKERLEAHLDPEPKTIIQQTSEGRWLKITERRTPSGLIVGIRTDVTDIKATEAELREKQNLLEVQASELRGLAKEYLQAKVKAEDATQAKSEFLAIISHELRTPMTGILGLTDILLASDPDASQQNHLDQLKLSATSLLELLNDILDYSKFEAGKLELEKTEFNVIQIGKAVIELLGPVAASKSIKLHSTINVTDDDCVFLGDGNRVRQILLNLASNAVKFTESGQVTILIEPETVFENYVDILFKISDTGIGISEQQITGLFEPFSQADSSTTRKFGGTGLGLSICKKLVSAMGGVISVESELGKGSEFSFVLRLTRGDPAKLVSETDKARNLLTRNVDGTSPKLSILLAEDVDINRMIVSTVLKKWGHTVEEVVNGKEAVDKASGDEQFDLILMDMQMPEMDGCDAAIAIRQMKGANSNTPIIALTADIQASQNERYNQAGLDAFLHKPVDWDMLEEAILKFSA